MGKWREIKDYSDLLLDKTVNPDLDYSVIDVDYMVGVIEKEINEPYSEILKRYQR